MSALAQDPVSTVPPASSPWEASRAQLTALRTECLRQREEPLTATASHGVDAVVWARNATLERTLAEIEAALTRIEVGGYGTCVGCGSAIPGERLELRPFADTCVPCASSR
jgi:DnaK suppressor protein